MPFAPTRRARRTAAVVALAAACTGVAALATSGPAGAAPVACLTPPPPASSALALAAARARELARPPARGWVPVGVPARAPRAVAAGRVAASARPAAAVTLPPDGSFILRTDHRVFELVGGAPLYVSSWALFGGNQGTVGISDAQARLIRRWPRDGTFVRVQQDGHVHEYVGSAPLAVTSWAAVGGPKRFVRIDGTNLVHAGAGDPYLATSLNPAPAEIADRRQLFVRGTRTGRVYALTGGAPEYVHDWAAFGGVKPVVGVDQSAVDGASNGQPRFRFLSSVPLDGWPVRTPDDNRVYVVAGGAPVFTTTLDGVGVRRYLPTVPVAVVDPAVVRFGGRHLYPYVHLGYRPADGTVLRATLCASPALWRVSAGHLADDPATTDGAAAVDVDPQAIRHAGEPAPWDHLLAPLPG